MEVESLPPKGCYMVGKDREDDLRRLLLSSGMAKLVPEDEIPKQASGALLLCGMFAVSHKPLWDRLIFDRRPCNHYDQRLAWAELPLGAQLTQFILEAHEVLRGSGDDLRTFFYALKNADEATRYNCFGRVVEGGGEWDVYGAVPGTRYRLALNVVAMGDRNAVDIAQATHEGVLRSQGCMREDEVLRYGGAFPSTKTVEGTYIDDHFTVAAFHKKGSGTSFGTRLRNHPM